MKQTALTKFLQSGNGDRSRASNFKEYRGAVAAANFGDVEREFHALQSGCAVFDLGFRVQLSLTGNDCVRWLNGMVSNKIKDLPEGHGVYAFVLNPQGHILADLYAFNRGESLVVETDHSQVEKILALFRRYIISDKVEIKDLSEDITSLGIAGPMARKVLTTAGLHIPEMAPLQAVTPRCDCACDCLECTLVRIENSPAESYTNWMAPGSVKQAWEALLAAGATPVGSEALEKNRIACGIPLYGVDIRERELPHETEQMRALHFQKGCYIGQEIVERIRSRGNVHRKFTGFVCDGLAQIAAGDKVVLAEKEVGEITSVTTLHEPEGRRTVALGYIRRESGAAGREVTIGTHTAIVADLPLSANLLHKEQAAVHQ